jgi:hypothetical protein
MQAARVTMVTPSPPSSSAAEANEFTSRWAAVSATLGMFTSPYASDLTDVEWTLIGPLLLPHEELVPLF